MGCRQVLLSPVLLFFTTMMCLLRTVLQPNMSCAPISQIRSWRNVQLRYLPRVIQWWWRSWDLNPGLCPKSNIANTDLRWKKSHFLSPFLPFCAFSFFPSSFPSFLPSLSFLHSFLCPSIKAKKPNALVFVNGSLFLSFLSIHYFWRRAGDQVLG